MARKFINEKGFTGYLIPVLNHYYCEKCYNEWVESAEYYEEDRWFEERKIEYYDSILFASN